MTTVSYDLDNLPPIPEEEKARYRAMAAAQLAGTGDDDIDYSDIPPITDFSGFMNAEEFKAHRAALRKERQAAKEAATV